jgi:hypothetical protein
VKSEITLEQAVEIAESAFRPLECIAEVQDYDSRVGFRVYGPDNQPLLTVEDLTRSKVKDSQRLESILQQARERVTNLGFELSPWSLEV